jgi:hypothetical protein
MSDVVFCSGRWINEVFSSHTSGTLNDMVSYSQIIQAKCKRYKYQAIENPNRNISCLTAERIFT